MPTQRIEYIDAMRGFTMLLVVYCHIVVQCLHIHSFTFNHLFLAFIMPLFFFISGWVMYKARREWGKEEAGRYIKNKFLTLIIPSVVFWVAFICIFQVTDTMLWFDAFKCGYWFTYALFQYFLFYVITMMLVPRKWKNTKKEDAIVITVAATIAIVSLCTRLLVVSDMMASHNLGTLHAVLAHYIGAIQWYYYVFFCLGTLVKKYFNTFIRLTDNKWFMAIIIACTFILAILQERTDGLTFIIPGLLLPAMCIFVIFTFFRKNEQIFTKDTRLGRTLQHIGRRTLDIYMLHYFFLPKNLRFVGDFFDQHSNPTLEFFISMALALMVVALSLAVSNVIRLSPLLAKYLFGVKEKHQ